MVNRLETVTSSHLIGDRDCSLSDWRQIGVSLSWGYQRGKLPPHFWEGHSVNSCRIYIYIALECSASGMAWVEHQGLYMRVSREMGFEKGMNENFSKESMNWGLDGEVYWCGIWLRGWEWFLKSSKDGLDLFWTWQRAWNDKWMEAWFLYIYIDFKIVVPFRRPYYRTSHCYSELSSRLLRQVVSPHDYLHFCRWSCIGASNRKGN